MHVQNKFIIKYFFLLSIFVSTCTAKSKHIFLGSYWLYCIAYDLHMNYKCLHTNSMEINQVIQGSFCRRRALSEQLFLIIIYHYHIVTISSWGTQVDAAGLAMAIKLTGKFLISAPWSIKI